MKFLEKNLKVRRAWRSAMLLILIVACGLAGCESKSETTQSGQTATASTASPEQPGTSVEPEAAEESDALSIEKVTAWSATLDAEARAELLTALGCASEQAPADTAAATPEPPVDAAPTPVRQTDVINRQGNPLTLLGPTLEVGQEAPEFELVDQAMQPVRSTELGGAPLVVSVVPSLDTPVCEAQTGMMLSRLSELPEGTKLVTVSRDLPFAQKRFVEHKREAMEIPDNSVIVSDYDDGSFGRNWGLAVEESGLLARSVWVIDGEGKVVYREIVADQATEPDYDAVVEAAKKVGATE